MKGRCGGIGRHAVLRGQWGNPCQFESGHRHRIARGIKARCFMHACKILMMMLFAGQAHALLLGEKARNAPIAGLKSALLRYKLGETHESVWQHTRWYCPFRNHIGCRWEIADNCTSVNHLNITRLKHTSFTGKVPLWKVFNVACVWQRYPSLKEKIFIYYDGTKDAAGICDLSNLKISKYMHMCCTPTMVMMLTGYALMVLICVILPIFGKTYYIGLFFMNFSIIYN